MEDSFLRESIKIFMVIENLNFRDLLGHNY